MNLSLINFKRKIKNFLVLFLIYSFFIIIGDLIYSNFMSNNKVSGTLNNRTLLPNIFLNQ